jgi:hypothetical protein
MRLNQGRIGSSLLNRDVAATALGGLAPRGRALESSALSSVSDTSMHTPQKPTPSAYRSAEMKCWRMANSTPTGPTTASSCHPGHCASYPHEFLGRRILRSDAPAGRRHSPPPGSIVAMSSAAYSSAGCSPAEPASASPAESIISQFANPGSPATVNQKTDIEEMDFT